MGAVMKKAECMKPRQVGRNLLPSQYSSWLSHGGRTVAAVTGEEADSRFDWRGLLDDRGTGLAAVPDDNRSSGERTAFARRLELKGAGDGENCRAARFVFVPPAIG